MKHLASRLLPVALLAGVSALSASTAQPHSTNTEVRAIIDRALERAVWAKEQAFEASYRHARAQRTRKFDKQGEVEEDERRLYRVEPVRGVSYARLVAKNGGPLEGDDLKTERERWHNFLEELDRDPDEQDEEEEDQNIVFNNELLDRFMATLDGIRDLRGRPSYVISFEPRPGKLPVRRRIDRALNKSRGEIWIDQATYEIARVNFELIERVRIWWGILGSISDVTGHYEREQIAEDVWLPTEVNIHFHVRVLFSTTRRGETTHWSDFEPVAECETDGCQPTRPECTPVTLRGTRLQPGLAGLPAFARTSVPRELRRVRRGGGGKACATERTRIATCQVPS